ncbi:Alpha/Beta hydrolase protein [Circinella umbellata]|nr:Alpha/Beta hydrolase protein [Circinella umbellata]
MIKNRSSVLINTSCLILLLLCSLVVNGALDLLYKTNGSPHVATEQETKDFKYYMTLASNSYCDAVIPRRQWDCPNCGKTSHMEIVQVFVTPEYDINAMVVRDDNLKRIISVFRGSKTEENFIADGEANPVNYENIPGALVHSGFYEAYKEVATDIVSVVREQVQQYPDYTLATTGHSLGAAIATLHGLDLYRQDFEVAVYSYAQPRLGNRGFALYAVGSGLPYHRITSRRDLYVDCPIYLLGVLSYVHAGEEAWIQENDEILICPNGLESDDCYNSDNGLRSNDDHYKYFDLENNRECLFQGTTYLGYGICSVNQFLELSFLD